MTQKEAADDADCAAEDFSWEDENAEDL